MTPRESFMKSMYDRFACKRYRNQPIASEDMDYLLEAGRLSPTSFGLEGWHFHVVTDMTLRKAMTDACFDQESVATAPMTVVIVACTAASYDPHGPFVRERGERFPGTLQEFVDDYIGYYQFLKDHGRIDCWSRAQCYIAAANMMQAGAVIGIQSCAIEGFDAEKIALSIDLDTALWQPAIVITFGYPDEPVREKIRASIDTLTTYH